MVHGVPIEGPGSRLDEIAKRHRLHALVYALNDHDESVAAAWVARAHGAALPLERAPGGADVTDEPQAIMLDRMVRVLGRPDASPSTRAQTARCSSTLPMRHLRRARPYTSRKQARRAPASASCSKTRPAR